MENTREGCTYRVVWPRSRMTVAKASYAKRLDSIEGKTIGELWDGVFQGDQIFPMVERELAKRYRDVRFVNYRTFGLTHSGADAGDERKVLESLPEKLRQNQCDAVISGVGC